MTEGSAADRHGGQARFAQARAHQRVRGLYAITPEERDTQVLVEKVRLALAGGARVVQYRDKSAHGPLRIEQARALLEVCRAAGVPLIVNDDLELALACGADGVHLGREDGDLAAARAALGPLRLLGASCYAQPELALRALAAGADHVAFGSVFASPTKPGAGRAPLEVLREARRRLAVPIVAIGGITADNVAQAIEAGADAAAVISAVFDAPRIEAAARAIARQFPASAPPSDRSSA